MKTKFKTLALFFVLSLSWSYAQQTISGKVQDEKAEPLIGVNVIIKGTSNGVTTDFDGKYAIKASNGDLLEFSYVGFTTKKLVVGEANSYDVTLKENASALDEVVLTSRKKNEYARDIPISITAIGGKQLQKSGSFEFTDYASKVPNLSFGKQGGGGDLADGRASNSISIRGITGNATTAFYLDEIPLPETIDPKLVDIKQIEVLRGPQGTLYGSSAMGGALRVLTNEPSTKAFFANAGTEVSTVKEGGVNFGTDAVFNIPIKEDKSALRLVGFYNSKSGIYDKVPTGFDQLNDNHPALTETQEDVDDERTYGFHAGLKFTPNDKWTILPKFILQNTEADGYNLADIAPGNFTTIRSADIDEEYEDNFTSTSLTVKFDAGKGEFVSVSSYFDRSYSETEDATEFFDSPAVFDTGADGLSYPTDITRTGDYDKFIQELRYVSDTEAKVNFSAGVFYANETLDELSDSRSPGLGDFINDPNDPLPEPTSQFDIIFLNENETKIREVALFTELYIDITEKLKGTVGVRYFDAKSERERTSFPSLVTGFGLFDQTLPDIEEDGFNPKFGLSYKINENNLLYTTVSKGFRLGGVNAFLPAFSQQEANDIFGDGGDPDDPDTVNVETPATYDSDFLWSYELGGKLATNNRKFVVNAALFYNDWNNLQLRSLLPASGFNFLTNVGGARTIGFELDATIYPTEGLTIGTSFGILDTEISDLGGNIFAQAEEGAEILLVPSLTAAGNAEYSWEAFGGNMFVRGDLQYSGERFSSFDRTPERTLDAYTIVNSRIGLQIKKVDFAIFVNNLTNENANFGDVISLAAEVPGRVRYAASRPITVGTSFRFRF